LASQVVGAVALFAVDPMAGCSVEGARRRLLMSGVTADQMAESTFLL